MSAPDRPTREQVDAALERANTDYSARDVDVLAAEVRALWAVWPDVQTVVAEVKRLRGLDLTARTPQPAEEHRYLSTACLHLDHGYCGSIDGYDADGDPFRKRAAQCKWCTAPCVCPCHAAVVPLPAVPDGEDGAPDLRDAVQRVGEYVSAHQQQGVRRVDLIDEKVFDDNRGGWSGELYASDLRVILDAVHMSEEDVPARLGAALLAMCDEAEAVVEDALAATGTQEVPVLDVAEVRAAVAAALSRPTGDLS